MFISDKNEIERLNREKDALEKQVALINGQMLLVEGGRKRLDDVVDDLQTEIVSLRQQLEEAEKKYVFVRLLYCCTVWYNLSYHKHMKHIIRLPSDLSTLFSSRHIFSNILKFWTLFETLTLCLLGNFSCFFVVC